MAVERHLDGLFLLYSFTAIENHKSPACLFGSRVFLVVDEWGPWYKPGSELTPGDQIEQLPTLRDAVFSGMTLGSLIRC